MPQIGHTTKWVRSDFTVEMKTGTSRPVNAFQDTLHQAAQAGALPEVASAHRRARKGKGCQCVDDFIKASALGHTGSMGR